MAGFLFRLETVDGAPAEPSRLEASVPNWRVGDVISLGSRQLRVIGKRDDDADQAPVLVVEECGGEPSGNEVQARAFTPGSY
jgi:hypothetical protein